MFTLLVNALRPGMILWDDIYIGDRILLRANSTLDNQKIQLLKNYHILEVNLKSVDDVGVSQFERIHKSKDFKVFEAAHQEALVQCKRLISNLANRIPVNYSSFAKIPGIVLNTVNSDDQLIDFLSNMVSNEYEITYTHCLNSALLCQTFGRWLNYTPEHIEMLTLCGFLYDIGKTQLPEELIWKSGTLTPEETYSLRTHIHLGYDLLKTLNAPQQVLTTVAMHHERCDGSGYPAGFKKNQIHPDALFIGLVDSYDAMTHVRVNRAAMTPFQTVRNYENDGLDKYDINIIKPVLRHIVEHYLHCHVVMNNGMIGEIVEIHDDMLSAPSVQCENMVFDTRVYTDLKVEKML